MLYAIGEAAPVVMSERGHTHPALALRIYAAAMRRNEDEDERLRALIDGGLSQLGSEPVRDRAGLRASEPGTKGEVADLPGL